MLTFPRDNQDIDMLGGIMRKIISMAAMVCLSFTCFAENCFVKIGHNRYVLQHGKQSVDNSNGFLIYLFDAVYTPTHIFTYPDGNPAYFRDIQKVEYTESKVTFIKDMKSKKCCIDIYDGSNSNKCRIIGMNGHNITVGKNYSLNLEVYEVAAEANSFTDNNQRLIYVDQSGLYIVSEKENPVKFVVGDYQNNGFRFKGEIIKISAIDGKREVLGFDENKKEIFAFNCPSNALVSFEVEATPVMKQIEEIASVKLVTPPPSEEVALKRMAEILDVPAELLVFERGLVKLVKNIHSLAFSFFSNNPLEDQLRRVIPLATDHYNPREVDKKVIEEARNYKFDTSPEAQQRRREIALKPWDEE